MGCFTGVNEAFPHLGAGTSPRDRRGKPGKQILPWSEVKALAAGPGTPGQSQGQGWLPSLPAASCQWTRMNKWKSRPLKTAMSSNSAVPTLGSSPHPSPADRQGLPRPVWWRLGHHRSRGPEKSRFALSGKRGMSHLGSSRSFL